MRKSKIDEFHVSRIVKDDVLEFQVAMSELFLMAMAKRAKDLLEVKPARLFAETVDFLNDGVEVDLAHLEDDRVDLGLLRRSFGLEGRVLEDVKDFDDGGVGSDGLHGHRFALENFPTLKYFYDHLLLLFFLNPEL